jgi:hypothetical protein
MAKITISIPDNIYEQMKQYPEINWNYTIQNAFIKQLEVLRLAEKTAQQDRTKK